jgi:pyruvate dehydrogenase (quinone)
MTTVAAHIVDALADAGVRRIYGVVGDSLNSIVDAVHHSKKIEWVHVRHEEAGAFVAGAEAQLTGKLAVCAGSCGPGNLHLINGLFDAHKTLAPVLAIAAQVPSSEMGTDFFQETHPERLFQECSHYCQLVSTEKQMPRVLQIAMQTSVTRGGVSVLVLPGNVAACNMTSTALEHPLFPARPAIQPCAADLRKLAEVLDDADRVTLFCGAGCAGAHEEVLELAKRLQAPVAYTFRGKEFVEHDNPYATGIEALVPMLKKKKSDKHLKDCMQKYRDTQKSLERRAEANGRSRTLPPEHLTAVLNDVADDDAIFTVDTGMTAVWAARHLRMTHRRRLIGSFNYGSMANAMPQAIGAQLAFPKRQVICMSGDGGFSMLLGDLLTIAQYELPIKLVIYNNSSLAMVKLEMRVAGYEDFGVDVQNLDFSKIADAVGIRGFRIEDAKDLKSTLAKAVRHPGAALIDVVTNPNALALPPKIDANELAGYGLYVAKQTLHGRLFQSVEELKGNIP